MKKFISVFAAAGILATMVSCKKDESSEKSNVSTEPATETATMEVIIPLEMPDIDISIPVGYQETSTENNSVVYIKDDASIIVNSDKFTENYKTLTEYVDVAVETFDNISDEMEILSREKYGENGELLEYIYKLNTDNGVFSKYCMVGFFTDGEQLYLVSCKADTDTYTGYRDEFLEVMASVALK